MVRPLPEAGCRMRAGPGPALVGGAGCGYLGDAGADPRTEDAMGKLIVTGLDNLLVDALEARAAAHGRTPEEEGREILAEALEADAQARRDAWFEEAKKFRERAFPNGYKGPSTTDLLRADRDRDD